MHQNEAKLRVRYAETDQMGVVHHANYLIWMEIGRVEYVRSLGINYKDLEEQGYYLSVVGTACRYLHPARYDQEVVVATELLNANPRILEFGYEIRLAGCGTRLAEASSRHLWLSRDWRPTRLPAEYQQILYAGANQEASIRV